MCHIISSTVVCGKIVISMCFDIFYMFYSCIRWFVFSSIFPLHNCIPVSPSLKSILKITIFCVVEKPLFRRFLSWMAFHTCLFTKKSQWRFRVIFYIFNIKYWFSYYFFISLYYICRIYSTLTLGENGKCYMDWFIADEIGMSTNNGGCCIFFEFMWR